MAHCLLTTFGSLGDLHPYIAVGLGLRERGHTVTIATSEVYRPKVEGEGLRFHPVRPDAADLLTDPDMMSRAFHPRTGSEYIVRRIFLPWLEQSYEDLLPAAKDADLILGHPIAFATPMAAEKLGKPWISVALAPLVMLSKYDPPAVSGAPFLNRLHSWGPGFWGLLWFLARTVVRRWGIPINALRSKLDLPEQRNPVIDDMFSPYGTQAWFTRALARLQPDWPPGTVITGFPFYDKFLPGQGMSTELNRFLDGGPPPVVFTLGSSAVLTAGDFYVESVLAAKRIGCRAVLLVGNDPRNLPEDKLPPEIMIADYAPYSELFPRAAVNVHQGGVGTTAQALRSGRPMIVVPYSHDQPDNAMRVMRLGVAQTISRRQYKANRVADILRAMLNSPACLTAARQVALTLGEEDGVGAACDGIEGLLH